MPTKQFFFEDTCLVYFFMKRIKWLTCLHKKKSQNYHFLFQPVFCIIADVRNFFVLTAYSLQGVL